MYMYMYTYMYTIVYVNVEYMYMYTNMYVCMYPPACGLGFGAGCHQSLEIEQPKNRVFCVFSDQRGELVLPFTLPRDFRIASYEGSRRVF